MPGTNKVAQDFAKRLKTIQLENYEITDLFTEIGLWNFETSALLVLDKRLGGLEMDSKAERLNRKVVNDNLLLFKYSGILKHSFPFYKYLSTRMYQKVSKAEDEIYGYAMKLVDEAILRLRDEVEAGSLNADKFNFLSYLISRDELSLKDVTIICLSAWLDGLSTTSPTTLFCLYCLATDQRIQQKVYNEILEVLGPDPHLPLRLEHINQMPYLKAFVKETQRLWPNGTEVSRTSTETMVLSGFEIPAGTDIDLNPSVHFRNEKYFPEPDKHIPERWLRKDEAEKFKDLDLNVDVESLIEATEGIHPFLLTPFGHGTRMCVGRRFAEMHMYVLISTILRHFKLDYNVDKRMDSIYYTLLFPDRPLRVEFKPRL